MGWEHPSPHHNPSARTVLPKKPRFDPRTSFTDPAQVVVIYYQTEFHINDALYPGNVSAGFAQSPWSVQPMNFDRGESGLISTDTWVSGSISQIFSSASVFRSRHGRASRPSLTKRWGWSWLREPVYLGHVGKLSLSLNSLTLTFGPSFVTKWTRGFQLSPGGLCPWTPLEAPLLDPFYTMTPPSPLSKSWISPQLQVEAAWYK